MNWTKELVIKEIQERHSAGKPLNYSAVVADNEPLAGAARRLFGNWGKAVEAAGFDYEKIKQEARPKSLPRGTWSKELIIQKIRERYTAGQSLNPHAVQKDDPKLYAASRLLGSWGKAVEAAGYDYIEHRKTLEWSPEKVIKRIKYAHKYGADLSDKTVIVLAPALYGAARTHFGGWQQAVEAAGLDYSMVSRTVRWSRAKIINMIQEVVSAGKPLTRDSFPSVFIHNVYNHFESWEAALEAAGYKEKPWAEVDRDIKNNIRKLRKEAGLSETELGGRLGVSHRTISMLELSQYIDPRVSFAIQIARALGRKVEEIFEIDQEGGTE